MLPFSIAQYNLDWRTIPLNHDLLSKRNPFQHSLTVKITVSFTGCEVRDHNNEKYHPMLHKHWQVAWSLKTRKYRPQLRPNILQIGIQSNITLIITGFAWNFLFHRNLKLSITVVTHYWIVLWYSFSTESKKNFKSSCFAKMKTVAKEKYWMNLFWINLKHFAKIATYKTQMFVWTMLSPMSIKNLELNTFYSAQIEPCMSIFYWYKNFILYLYIPT